MEATLSTGNLREVECRVCGDKASGKHYGVPSCDGCRGFFKRSIRRNLDYVCKEAGSCVVDVTRRNQCQSCRFKKCLKVNMKRDAVQHERAPRANGLGKGRHPYQTFTPAPPPSIYFPTSVVGGSPFKHSSGSGFYASSSFIQAAAAVSHHHNLHSQHNFSSTAGRLLFSPTQFGIGSTGGSRSSGTLIPIPEMSLGSKEKPLLTSSREEEVSTTTNNEHLLDFYHPCTMPSESVYESAAKLLFLSIKWARSVPSFGGLSGTDQATLLENSWSELFILSAVQWGLVLEETFLHGKNQSDMANAQRLMDILRRITTLSPDHTELACLKAVVLFKPEVVTLSSEFRVEVLQDQTLLMLQEYVAAKTPLSKVRFGKLLLIFSTLKSVSSSDLEDLFFKHTVGEVSIQRLISDLVKSTF